MDDSALYRKLVVALVDRGCLRFGDRRCFYCNRDMYVDDHHRNCLFLMLAKSVGLCPDKHKHRARRTT